MTLRHVFNLQPERKLAKGVVWEGVYCSIGSRRFCEVILLQHPLKGRHEGPEVEALPNQRKKPGVHNNTTTQTHYTSYHTTLLAVWKNTRSRMGKRL